MIRKFFVLISLFLMFSQNVLCFSYDEQLKVLELNKYGQSYCNDALSDRLLRLETDLLGMEQSGDIDRRINLLQKMSENVMFIPSNDSYLYEKPSTMKNIWNNMTSSFSNGNGFMTGYIPPLVGSYDSIWNNSKNFCPYYNRYYRNGDNHQFRGRYPIRHHRPSRIGMYSPRTGYNPYGNWKERPVYGYTNVSTGSSVHILND